MNHLFSRNRLVPILGFILLVAVSFFIGYFFSNTNQIISIGDSPFSYREDITYLNYVEKDLDSLNIRVIKLLENENRILIEIVPMSVDDSVVGWVSPIYAMLLDKHGYRERIIAMKCHQISMESRNLIQVEGPIKKASAVCIGCFYLKDLFQYKVSGNPIPFFLKRITLSKYEQK